MVGAGPAGAGCGGDASGGGPVLFGAADAGSGSLVAASSWICTASAAASARTR